MSMDVGGAKGGVKSDINVTPLVDVMLVLLIIMMLVARCCSRASASGCRKRDQHPTRSRRRPEQTVLAIAANSRSTSMPGRCRRAELATKVNEILESKTEKIVHHPRRHGGRLRHRDGGDGPAAHRGRRGHRSDHRPGASPGGARRPVMAHAHHHLGADKVVTGEVPHGQLRHERHAAHRRAARAAGHLHGDPAAQPARGRHQPAGRDQERHAAVRNRRSARSCSTTRPTARSASTSRT